MRLKLFSWSGLAVAGLITSFTLPAFASSPQAWAEHDRKVNQQCIAASGLLNTIALSKPIIFDDTVGYSAVTLRGHPKPMAGSQAKATVTQEKLCLYQRKTGRVHIEDISPATR